MNTAARPSALLTTCWVLLIGAGACWADEPSLQVHGWASAGYSYASSGEGLLAVEPLLNRFGREFLVNQFALVLENPAAKDRFSPGFYAQLFAGADAAALQGPGDIQSANPRFGAVLRQVYLEAHLPALTEGGLDLRVGRRGSLMGFESYMTPLRSFYSLSYQWNFAEDGADTGAWLTWHGTPQLDATYGVTLGSNTFFTLAGNGPCHLLQTTWWPDEARQTALTATLIVGDEAVGKTRPANPGSLATVVELRGQHAWNDRLTTFLQVNLGTDQSVPGVGLGRWYGVLAASVVKLTDSTEAALRAEWFDDAQGTRTGFATNYAAVTAAATWRPWNRVMVRPEVRGDFAGRSVFGPVSGGSRTPRQLTAAVECVISY